MTKRKLIKNIAVVLATPVIFAIYTSINTAIAQTSPKCQLNGKWTFCSVTSQSRADDEKIEESIAFANGVIYDVSRRGFNGCRHDGKITTCNAKVIDRGNGWKSIPAYYKGTYYEGGYKHEYISGGLSLTYYYMD